MFDTSQRRRFRRNGFVVLRDALDADLVREARWVIEDETMRDGNQNEPETEPFRSINRQLFAYAQDLVGEGRLLEPGHPEFGTVDDEETRIGLHYPAEDAPRVADPHAQRAGREGLGVHLDHQSNGDGALFALGAAVYFDDVWPRDAAFTVWPGSHWMAAEHCRPVTVEARGATLEEAAIREDSPFETIGELFDLFEPFEVTGEAGTVALWHGRLIHAAGMHLAPASLRTAGFSRFHVRPATREHGERFPAPFEGWAGVPAGEPTAAE